jgi:hypothetical protein
MESLVRLLLWPPLHFVLCMTPMAYVQLGHHVHAVMSDRFIQFVRQSWAPALVVAAFISLFHPWKIAMGAAFMSPYMQWLAILVLYRRFERKHGRLPRSVDEFDLEDAPWEDRLFNVSTSLAVLGLPLFVVIPLIWVVRQIAQQSLG